MRWLDMLLGPPPSGNRSTVVLSWLAAAMALIALLLFALQQSLRLPAHFGVEDWVGWANPNTLAEALIAWGVGAPRSRVPAATAYLLIDTALFMPLYGITLLWATRQILGTLRLGQGPAAWLVTSLRQAAVPLLLALWVTDAIENLGGLARLGVSWAWGLAALLLLAAPTFWLVRRWAAAGTRTAALRVASWLLLALALASVAAYALDAGVPWTGSLFGGWAHTAKWWLTFAALAPLFGLWMCWWFGLDLDTDPLAGPNAAAEIRSACRQVAVGVIGRSRYVLAVLALFCAFTLVLDQCRDVLLALITAPWSVWWFVIMVIGAVGLAMLSHACWLWARLVGRVKRSGYSVPDLDGVAVWAGEWARTWARLLMLVPLLLSLTLIANVAGDAVIAANRSPDDAGLLKALLVLAAFAVVIVGLAAWLMQSKRKAALTHASDYYNSVPAVRPLLHDPHVNAAHMVGPTGGRTHQVVSILAQPLLQPLVALALLVIVRGVMLLAPDVSATAPPALAVLSLALVWWLGPLGFIAMSEQRSVFPWALVLLLVAGVMGFVSDNHRLPALVIDDAAQVPSTLAALSRVAMAGVVLLAVVSAALWWVLTERSKALLQRFRLNDAVPRRHAKADRLRIALVVATVVVLAGSLKGIDLWAAELMPAVVTETAATPPRLEPSGAPQVKSTLPQGPMIPIVRERMLLLASEGGGVRAAYWTARVLAAMDEAHPGWTGQVHAMSGVSGGSMGIAVWRACERGDRKGGSMSDCVRNGFASLDALSPLLAGLLFEDVWMRLLPTDWLCLPDVGCGMRSRAMGFEREWMRAFPHLAQSLNNARDGEPHLMLNSTVVESGNRGVLSTLRFERGALPGAEDLIASGRIKASPSLVTAAHTSARFPITNPLASLPHQASGPAAAHLVDGGYHDNSGTGSLADLLTYVRAQYPDRPVQLVLIRNGQVPTACLPQAVKENHDEPPESCLKTRSDARELLPPADAQRLQLFADLFGPALTVVNNLGTGAHGREPVAALAARVASPDGGELPSDMGCRKTDSVCLLDQMQDASLVPLGWSLSRAARLAMDTAADDVAARAP